MSSFENIKPNYQHLYNSCQFNSIQFIFHQTNKHIKKKKKNTKMEEMQLKAKAWRMLHPLYN